MAAKPVEGPGPDAAPKHMKHVAQRNALERTIHDGQQRNLDCQRRAAHAQLAKEERDVRAHLRRLQEEQRLLADCGAEAGEYFLPLELDTSECGSGYDSPTHPDMCVNPYPIVFVSAATKLRSRQYDPEPELVVPVVAGGGGGSGPRAVPGRGGVGAAALCRTDSQHSILSSSPNDRDREMWVGDPEAILSVRRKRKSVRQQQLDHHWTRSHSLKERPPNSRPSSASLRSLVSRSQSLRESVRRSPNPDGSGTWGAHSRAGSLRDSRHLMTSIDSISESLSSLDLTPHDACAQQRKALGAAGALRMRGKNTTLPTVSVSGVEGHLEQGSSETISHLQFGGDEEEEAGEETATKSAVWGYVSPSHLQIECLETPRACLGGPRAPVRRRRQRVPVPNGANFDAVTSPLPPIKPRGQGQVAMEVSPRGQSRSEEQHEGDVREKV